jgi:hypothetical protein
MVDSHRSTSDSFPNRSDKDSKEEKYARIWYSHLLKFHHIPFSHSWSYNKEHVVQFLRSKKESGIPAWKRLKILQGILWHRVHIQHRSPDFLLELEKTLKKFVVHEKIRSMPSQEEIDGIVGKINPNEPDVIQLLRRALRAKGHAYNTEIAYVKKVVAFMADELGKKRHAVDARKYEEAMGLFEERVSDALGSLVTEFATMSAHGQGSLFRPCGTEELLRSLPGTEVLGYFLPSLAGLRTYRKAIRNRG